MDVGEIFCILGISKVLCSEQLIHGEVTKEKLGDEHRMHNLCTVMVSIDGYPKLSLAGWRKIYHRVILFVDPTEAATCFVLHQPNTSLRAPTLDTINFNNVPNSRCAEPPYR